MHPANEAMSESAEKVFGAPRSLKLLFPVYGQKEKIIFFQKSLADKKKAVHLQPLWETGRTKKEK